MNIQMLVINIILYIILACCKQRDYYAIDAVLPTGYPYAVNPVLSFCRLKLFGLVERKVEGDGNCQVKFFHSVHKI